MPIPQEATGKLLQAKHTSMLFYQGRFYPYASVLDGARMTMLQ